MNIRRALPFLALLALAGAALLWSGRVDAHPAQEARMTMPTNPQRLEQWLNPLTGERATLAFDGLKTTVERDGKVSTIQNDAFDERAALVQARDMLKPMYEWMAFNVLGWRDRLIGESGSVQAAQSKFQALGFPLKLWQDMDAYQKALGLTPSGTNGAGMMVQGYTSTTDENGVLTFDGPKGEIIVRPDDPAWKDNLLINPTPEIRRTFEELYLQERIGVGAPPADTSFHMQRQGLQEQGFIRLSTRHPDGSLWLPEVLEGERARLSALQRPVVRPVVVPGRPAPWDSKFGGVPYRPKGAAWPTQPSGRPLVFLAQLDLGVANKSGHLPDLPRHGLLQFFLGYADHPGADGGESGTAKVVYWPDIRRDQAALDGSAPDYPDDFEAEMFNPPERALKFIEDAEFPSLLDAHLDDVQRAVPDVDAANVHPSGHRLGGHAMLINAHFPPEESWRLLFQFDMDDVGGQIYGGDGPGGWLGFFLREADLRALNFSRVRLEMDAF